MGLINKYVTIIALIVLSVANVTYAGDFDRFLGSYVGHTIEVENGKDIHRDLSVVIKENGNGFQLEWKTTKIKASGKTKTKSYSIDFEPTGRENIFSSAMKANLFGGRQPLDPMKGDPYVWSRVNGDLLTVHAMIITEDGGYEMLTYKRTVVEEGLDLEFNRIKNGESLKTITAHLEKVQ